mgnify:CR=1 FL=1
MSEEIRKADPERFTVGKKTVLLDRFMTHFIKVGGLGIIVAVFLIFLFILFQIVPLFQGAKVREVGSLDAKLQDGVLIGVDEWGEMPFVFSQKGDLEFFPLEIDPETGTKKIVDGKIQFSNEGSRIISPEFEGDTPKWSAYSYFEDARSIVLGSEDGKVGVIKIDYSPEFTEDSRKIEVEVTTEGLWDASSNVGKITHIDLFENETRRLIGVVREDESGKAFAEVMLFTAKRSLFGGSELKFVESFSIDEHLSGTPIQILVGGRGDRIMVVQDDGNISYFVLRGTTLTFQQNFQPFGGEDPIVSSEWILGNVSVSFVSSRGSNEIWSSYLDEEVGHIVYAKIKDMPHFSGEVVDQSHSLRNRAYLIAGENEASLRYMTTKNVRWHGILDFDVTSSVIGPKYDLIYFFDTTGKIHAYDVKDPHPQAGFRAFFSKIWYEGQPEPSYSWQSTGGSSGFEPKLSVVPLVFGSIKGTLYAMLFALPISVLAAVYCSQFLPPEFKKVVKPAMEIMASLPSVVLGFLAALWLAPMWDNRVPSLLCVVVFIPLGTLIFGLLWGKLPQSIRMLVRPGWEFLVMIPAILFFGWLAWQIGPIVERMFFTVTDPTTGLPVADFRLWWPEFTGADFEQRNSLVVGFVMGFTVIPLIFTISEDSMSNVPPYLSSASLALGASRWQTAARIVLPTASPGIFSATMIGLGRAVGETMIVVMATGNTPVMDWNIFNGMRTLAANIAVELPEAPKDGTLYRTLFLGAMLLFLMTFVVNTAAEVIRQRLRERYKTV